MIRIIPLEPTDISGKHKFICPVCGRIGFWNLAHDTTPTGKCEQCGLNLLFTRHCLVCETD